MELMCNIEKTHMILKRNSSVASLWTASGVKVTIWNVWIDSYTLPSCSIWTPILVPWSFELRSGLWIKEHMYWQATPLYVHWLSTFKNSVLLSSWLTQVKKWQLYAVLFIRHATMMLYLWLCNLCIIFYDILLDFAYDNSHCLLKRVRVIAHMFALAVFGLSDLPLALHMHTPAVYIVCKQSISHSSP